MLKGALEHGQAGFGLVERNFVTGFVDAEEANCWCVSQSFDECSTCRIVLEHLQLPYCLTSPNSSPSTMNFS